MNKALYGSNGAKKHKGVIVATKMKKTRHGSGGNIRYTLTNRGIITQGRTPLGHFGPGKMTKKGTFLYRRMYENLNFGSDEPDPYFE